MQANDLRITNAYLMAPMVSSWVRSGVIGMLGLALSAAVAMFSAAPLVHGATGSDAMTMVKSTVNQTIDILKDHQTPQDVRRRRLIQTVEGHFDFADMARSSLGYHWRQLTPDQQQRFVTLFTAFMEDAYLSKLEGYSGQKIEFLNESRNGPGDSHVSTRVIQPNGGPPVSLDYGLKQEGGDWKVYEVTVDNISITANYRNQFNRVINSQGFDALMSKMQSRQQELQASLGKGGTGS